MSAELMFAASLGSSAALVLAMALRRPLRRIAGAGAAYALWIAVPLAVLAAVLPSAGTRLSLPPLALHAVVAAPVAALPSAPQAATVSTGFWIWLAGCVAMLALQALQQWLFMRSVNDCTWRGRIGTASTEPCVSGLWRPAILLPRDFRHRYDRRERRLVLAHEIAHLRRGDVYANVLAALLRAVFWFNPLLHIAVPRFRLDQELACDARVLARFPEARRCYAGAMLKTQLGGAALRDGPGPLGCGWFSPHPLKERIDMLHYPLVCKLRRRLGAAAAGLLIVASAGLAWAAKPAASIAGSSAATPAASIAASPASKDGHYVDAALTLRIGDGVEQRFRMINRFGESFLITSTEPGANWEAHFVATAVSADSIRLATRMLRNGERVAAPELLLHDGESGGIKLDGAAGQGALVLDVVLRRSDSPQPQDGPAAYEPARH